MTSQTFFFIFVPILAIILLAINLIFAPHNPYQEKDSAFECGFHSFLGQNRSEFSISFFIFGLLFLLFDLEILLVYPYIVSAYVNEGFGLTVMLIFFLVLTLGFAFELGKNALSIDSRQANFFKQTANKNNKVSNGNKNLWDINLNQFIRYASPTIPISLSENRQLKHNADKNLDDKYQKFVAATEEVASNDGKIEGYVNRMKAIILDNIGIYDRITRKKVENAERECEDKKISIQKIFDNDITAHQNNKVNLADKIQNEKLDYEEQIIVLKKTVADRLCLEEAGIKYNDIIKNTRVQYKDTDLAKNILKAQNKVEADSLSKNLDNAIKDSAELESKRLAVMEEHIAAQTEKYNIEDLATSSNNFHGETGGDQTGGDD